MVLVVLMVLALLVATVALCRHRSPRPASLPRSDHDDDPPPRAAQRVVHHGQVVRDVELELLGNHLAGRSPDVVKRDGPRL